MNQKEKGNPHQLTGNFIEKIIITKYNTYLYK